MATTVVASMQQHGIEGEFGSMNQCLDSAALRRGYIRHGAARCVEAA
jgi:hypothetical protein